MERKGGASRLLWAGVGIFAFGVAVTQLGGASFATIGLAIQVTGVAVLALNAARSRREARSRDEDSPG